MSEQEQHLLLQRIHTVLQHSAEHYTPSCGSKRVFSSLATMLGASVLPGAEARVLHASFESSCKWNHRERELLKACATAYGDADIDWETVSRSLAAAGVQKSPASCLMQWRNVDDPALYKGPWTNAETRKLLELVETYNEHHWDAVADELNTHRTPIECLRHYQLSCNAKMCKINWTKEEDAILTKAVQQYGEKHWQAIASCLPGRAAMQCLLRWKKSPRANASIHTGRWTEEEERRLFLAVVSQNMDTTSWVNIAALVPGRDPSRCREKWVNVLDPSVKRGPFTPEEDQQLLELVQATGAGRWSKIAQQMPGRTDNMCLRRWKLLKQGEADTHLQRSQKRRELIPSKHKRRKAVDVMDADDFEPQISDLPILFPSAREI